ncbi:pyridoxamine 5'-phosphate oxidase family protein [Streptomyces ovatisporus]|uniref:Pyridoxamine 5'-phosphate oxidase family protein n=1 Tax=Streptomyces ovatisporus TaxID=1128682 RepID=A0ABV9A6W8_9ACTN
MAEADAAHPRDGRNARAQHEHERSEAHWFERRDRHDRTASGSGPLKADGAGASGKGDGAGHADGGGLFGGSSRPGSDGERVLQRRLGTTDRAERFYDEQVLDHLNERMREFVQRQEMFFLATADRHGECDSSFRAGPPGFLRVLDERTLVYPEYRGNGVHASLGNIEENPHLGIMLIDFTRARIGLHINGRAAVVGDAEIRASYPELPEDPVPGRRAQLWVRVEVEEAYIHCAKHIPQLQRAPKRTAREWGTDDYKRKGGDFFGTARDAREREAARSGAGAGERVPAMQTAQGYAASRGQERPSAYDRPPGHGRGEVRDSRSHEPQPHDPRSHEPRVPGAEPGATASAAAGSAPGSGSGAGTPGAATPGTETGTDSGTGTGTSGTATSGSGSRTGAGLLGTDREAAWQLPEMPPPPRLLNAPPSQRGTSPQSGSSAFSPSSSWPSSASTGFAATSSPLSGPSTAADGASGAIAARGAAAASGRGSDPQAWRQEAERALAEAQRRGAVSERGTFQGWFG